MRVLFSTADPAHTALPPLLGDEQVTCGPAVADRSTADGRVHSRATAAGAFDLGAVAAKLPSDQQPDVVTCLVDPGRGHLPRNLAAFKCPRVALVTGTQAGNSPLTDLLRYLAEEPFDRLVLLDNRHHAPFFQAAGFGNLHWFPGLTFPHADTAVRAVRCGVREPRLAFAAETGGVAPRAVRLLTGLASRGVPCVQRAVSPSATLEFFGASLVGFNASDNGELNLRVFEILATGAALLTDRLAPESGFEQLFLEGREVAAYGSIAELANVARELLARPDQLRELRDAGTRWFDEHLSEKCRRRAFRQLAFDGISPPGFAFPPSAATRVLFDGDADRLRRSLPFYEDIQGLHRTQETVRVALDREVPDEVIEIYSTLPRVALGRLNEGAPADLAIVSRGHDDAGIVVKTARLWRHDERPGEPVAVAAPTGELAAARKLFQQGRRGAAFAKARRALEQDPQSAAARVLLGELSLARADGGALAAALFRQALALQPGDATIQALLAEAWRAQGNLREADEWVARALTADPANLRALVALARLRESAQQPDAAETVLHEATRLHGTAGEAARAMGDFLKRTGRLAEAMGWHRRSLGCEQPELAASTDRRRRVLFVVQQGALWPGVASVYAAFDADPAWETIVVAMPFNHADYTTDAERNAIFAFLRKEKIPYVRWDEFPLRAGCADAAFLPDPDDDTRPAGWRTEDLVRHGVRIAYSPYGFETADCDEAHTRQYNFSVQQLGWAIFAWSDAHKAMFRRHCAVGDAHVIVTGHPKTDALRKLDAARDPDLERFVAGRKVVCWNPHFDVRPDGQTPFGRGRSTFARWKDFLLEEFARRPELAFIVRPHPLFFAKLERAGVFTEAQLDEFVERCAAADNVHLDRRASFLPAFAASTAMLSDLSSFVLEFAVTGRPLLYLRNPHGPPLERHAIAEDFSAAAETETDIVRFLDSVAAGESEARATQRRAGYRKCVHLPAEGAGVAVKRAVEARLLEERRGIRTAPAIIAA